MLLSSWLVLFTWDCRKKLLTKKHCKMPLCSKYTVPKKKPQRKQSRESLCHPKSWVRSVKRLLDQCRQPQNANYPFAWLFLLLPWQTGSYFCGSMKNSTVHIVCGVSKPDSGSRFFPLAACLWMCGAHMLGVQRRLANCLFFFFFLRWSTSAAASGVAVTSWHL